LRREAKKLWDLSWNTALLQKVLGCVVSTRLGVVHRPLSAGTRASGGKRGGHGDSGQFMKILHLDFISRAMKRARVSHNRTT
jgi:hypothetical protein